MKPAVNFRSLILLGACAAFVLFRFLNLTDTCLWFDEIFSVHAATMPFGELLSFVAQDVIHPPLFYVLLKFWIVIGGESLLWLRLFPVLFSMAAVVPFFLFCRELRLKWQAIGVALFLIAVNGSLIKYSQEVRMYSLLLCLSLFSIWLFARFLNRGKNIWILTAVNVLLVYAHYAGWSVVAAEVAAVLIIQRIKIVQILKMTGIVAISFVPWAYTVWNSASTADIAQNIGWIERPGLPAMGRFILGLVEPFYYASSSVEPYSVYKVSVPLALLVLGAVAAYLSNRKRLTGEERANIKLLSLLILVPILLAFVISWISPYSIWGARHLIVAFVPFLMLCAIAITELGKSVLRTAVLTLVVLFAMYGLVIQVSRVKTEHIWCTWDAMAKEFAMADPPPSVLYVFEDLVAYHTWFATRGKDVQVIKVNSAGVKEDPAYFLPRGFDEVRTVHAADLAGDNLSVLFRAEKWDILAPPLSGFVSRGYAIANRSVRKVDGAKAFLVQLKKEVPTK